MRQRTVGYHSFFFWFSPKDFIPESLKSRVVYQFTCASCGARYIGETNRHFHTRVNEHLFRDKNSHVFRHLNCPRHCRDRYDASCFKIIDYAKTFSQLKIRESFHIERQSRSQRLHSFWSAPKMQDLWDNQCQNADESKSDWLLKFTGSLRVRSFKTGNENALRGPCDDFAGRFRSRQRRTMGKKTGKWVRFINK